MSNTLLDNNSSVDQFIAGVEELKASPETPKCPTCGKIKPEGVKCGCELVQILKIDYPNDGLGIFTYLKGYKYPFAGFADQNLVDLDAVVKRVLVSSIQFFIDKPVRYTLPILLGFKKSFIKRYLVWFSSVVDVAFKQWGHPQGKYLPKGRYCRSGREILRVGEMFIGDVPANRQFLMAIVMAWEFDNAYRFRGQDVLSNLNKDELRKHPTKEILRLASLLIARERAILSKESREDSIKVYGSYSDALTKWEMIQKLLKVGLFLSPSTKNLIKNILLEINVDEVKPTEGDWYFMSERWDYEFGGITYRDRLAKKIIEDREWKATLPAEPPPQDMNKPFIGYVPSESFWELDLPAAEDLINKLKENFLNEFKSRKMKT